MMGKHLWNDEKEYDKKVHLKHLWIRLFFSGTLFLRKIYVDKHVGDIISPNFILIFEENLPFSRATFMKDKKVL